MTPSEHLRLVDLRRLLYEEAPAEEARSLEVHLGDCDACSARLDAMRAEQATFLESAQPEIESAKILQRLDQADDEGMKQPLLHRLGLTRDRDRARDRGRTLLLLAPLATAALALFAIIPTLQPDAPTTRLKGGGAGLVMFVKDATGVHRGAEGERLTKGDQVQFRYAAAGRPHLFLVSVDARGVVSPLYPEDPTQSIAVQADGTHVLEGSVILDDAVGPERFFAVFSVEPVRFAEIDAAVRAARAEVPDVTALSALPIEREDVTQASVLIVKE